MSSSAAAYVVEAAKRHTATVLFLHGLGDTGAGWMSLAANWRRRDMFEHIKFIFPNAPVLPITVNFGMAMPAWYDIASFDDSESRSDDESGIMKTRDHLRSLIQKEVKDTGVPTSRMILGKACDSAEAATHSRRGLELIAVGGFSQGGAISIFTGVTSQDRLAGFFGLSSYLLMAKKLEDLMPSSRPNQAAPVFMGHGDSDPLVKYTWGEATAKRLQELGWKVDFRTYKGLDHGSDPQEMDDLERFIKANLPLTEGTPAEPSKLQ